MTPKPWKTITIGTHKTAEKLKADIVASGNKVSDWAWDIMWKTPLATEPQEVNLYRITVGELGFTSSATKAQIYERALSLGYVLLPAEVGPQLRLQYVDQQIPEYFWVGMEPITDSDGHPNVFFVNHDGDVRWLDGNYARPDRTWNPDNSWVFGRKDALPLEPLPSSDPCALPVGLTIDGLKLPNELTINGVVYIQKINQKK